MLQEENMRRRSVDMISGDVLEPQKEGPPRSVAARRNNSANSAAPSYVASEPPSEPSSWEPADSYNSAGDEPIRKVKGVRRPCQSPRSVRSCACMREDRYVGMRACLHLWRHCQLCLLGCSAYSEAG